MSSSPRRPCPECGRDVAVVGGRLARHDPPTGRGGAELVSCTGSKRRMTLDNSRPVLEGWAPPPVPGQMPLW
ncbi:hypothetical protein [Streptomyces sp. NBC_01304]|uniref:hypothetical protein n=1 Tax=Streptomyces sp. NBC_01304 TaxID=2903818 RepID=UPI002E11AD77|nr:hypothetical protein OG430_44250 [Streptomyces sp. NBC_01304]